MIETILFYLATVIYSWSIFLFFLIRKMKEGKTPSEIKQSDMYHAAVLFSFVPLVNVWFFSYAVYDFICFKLEGKNLIAKLKWWKK